MVCNSNGGETERARTTTTVGVAGSTASGCQWQRAQPTGNHTSAVNVVNKKNE